MSQQYFVVKVDGHGAEISAEQLAKMLGELFSASPALAAAQIAVNPVVSSAKTLPSEELVQHREAEESAPFTHAASIDDQRLSSGQIFAGVESLADPEDSLFIAVEVGSNPLQMAEHVPHVSLRADDDAGASVSLYKVGRTIVLKSGAGTQVREMSVPHEGQLSQFIVFE